MVGETSASSSRLDDDATSVHVRRAVAGAGRSLEWLILRFSPFLEAQARYDLRGRLGRYCDAHDLVNSVWERTLPRLPSLRIEDGHSVAIFIRYISKVLQNLTVELARKVARGEMAPASEGGGSPSLIERVPDDTTAIFTRVARRSDYRRVLDRLLTLSEKEYEVFVLRGIKGLENQDVATLLELSPNTVAQHFRRARRKLQEVLPDSSLLDG